jgi:hypothetical protein
MGILEPERLARSFTLNRPFTLKNKKNAVAPFPASSFDDMTDRIFSSSENASLIVQETLTAREAAELKDRESKLAECGAGSSGIGPPIPTRHEIR